MTTTARAHKNPYVGPQSFRRGDALYGRDREVADLLDLLIAERVVLLHSPSGAGKSSLIQARLITLLETEGFEVLPVIRLSHELPASLVDHDPPVNRYVLSALLSLEEGLPSRLQRPLPELARTSLAQYVAQWPDLDARPGNEVLILDQFEEVITADPVDHEAKVAFFADLGATLRDRSLWALFSMREDFVAELDPYARHVPTRLATRFRLDLLTVDQALEAVTCPARDAGVEFEEEAAVKLVDDLRRVRTQRGTDVVEELGRHVEPVQLQVTCRQIWEGLGDADHIGLDDIESAGDVNEALAGYYAASVAAVSRETLVPERALRDWFERELVTAQGFRGQVLAGPESATDAGGRVLELLTAAHLLRAESRRGATWYELAHDRLTQPIAEDNARWRAAHLSDVERRASDWDRQGRPDRLLATGADLAHGERWAAEPTATPTRVERDFLATSRKAQRQHDDLVREAVRTRRWLRVSVGLLALALVTAAMAVVSAVRAVQESDEAEKAAANAEQNALVAAGLGEIPFDGQLSILLTLRALASEAAGESPSSWEAANALQLALSTSPVVGRMGDRGADSVAAGWSSDGESVVTADDDGTVRLAETRSGSVLAVHKGVGEVESVALSPRDERQVAMGMANGSVLLWDSTEDGAPVPGPRHAGKVYDVAFSPDGSLLASAGADGAVIVSSGGDSMAVFRRPSEVNAVAWSADGAVVHAVDDSGALWVWDTESRRLVDREPRRHPKAIAIDVDVSHSGTSVATGGWDGQVVISRVDGRGEEIRANTTSGGQVAAVSFTSDDAHLLVLDQFGTVEVLDAATGTSRGTLTSAGQIPTSLQASPREPGRALVVTGDSAAAVWDTELGHQDHLVVAIEHTDDGRLMSAASHDDTFLFWSSDGQRLEDRREIRGASAWGAAIDPRGRFLVHTSIDGTARLTPLGGYGRERRLGTGVEVVAVSGSGRLVATGGQDSDIRVWRSRTGRQVAVLSEHTNAISGLDFGAADDRLVSGSLDGTVIVWDLKQTRPLRTIRAAEDPVTAVEWSPSGDLLALGRQSGEVELVEAVGGDDRPELDWHSSPVNDLSFDEAGERLVSVGDDGYAVVWNVDTGEMVRAVKHSSWVYRASFSPDGGHLVISGDSGRPVTVWLDQEALSQTAESRTTRHLTETECHRYVPEDLECDGS